MWIILLISLFLNLGHVHAEPAFALIRPIKGQESLPPHVLRQLKRISLQVASKQKGLQLLLSGDDPPTGSTLEVLALESEVIKVNGTYTIEARLVDIREKKIRSTTRRENIPEEYLIRLYQGALEAVFLPVKDADEEDEEKEGKKPELKVPPPPTVKDSIKPTTTQTRSQNESEVDFKKRLKDLKKEVDDKIAKAKEQNDAAAQAANNNTPPKSNSVGGMNAMDPIQTIEEKFPEPPKGITHVKRYVIDLGWERRSLTSLDLVETAASAELLTLRGRAHVPFFFNSGRLAWSSEGAVSRPLSVPADISTPYQIGTGLSLLNKSSFLTLGVIRDSSFFFNLPVAGEGLQTSIVDANWAKATGDITFNFKYPIGFMASVGTPLSIKSTYRSVENAKSWNGTFFQFAFRAPALVKNLESSIMYERSTLSTEGVRPFTLNETRLSILLRYSL